MLKIYKRIIQKSKKTERKEEIESQMTSVIEKLKYEENFDMIEKLQKQYQGYLTMIAGENKPATILGMTPDVAATVAANLTGILLILHHERMDIIATKALQFVMKGRV